MVRLVHWKPAESHERGDRIRAAGYECDDSAFVPGSFRRLHDARPEAIVIDLSRLPMQGRDVAAGIRARRSTRSIPIVFVDGDAERVERIRQLLPDAVYTGWGEIEGALRRAISPRVSEPVATRSALDGYRSTPLAKKLGVEPGGSLLLIDPPDDFPILEVGPGVKVATKGTKGDVVLWFVRKHAELEARLPRMVRYAERKAFWILWPKKSSARASDLTQPLVRKAGMACGLVDCKIASIDDTWAGLRFTLRKR